MIRSPDVQTPTGPARLLPADLNTLLSWHARFAVNPSSLAALGTMTHMVVLPGVEGGLGVQRVGTVLVASGEPLSSRASWPAFASAFLDFARTVGAVPCFAPVGHEFAAMLDRLGLSTVRLGSAPYVHLRDWPQTGNAGAGVRAAVNRAKRDGLNFTRTPADIGGSSAGSARWRLEVEHLSDGWLRRRRAHTAFHWIFQLEPLSYPGARQYFEARQEGRLVGLLAASPLKGRDCWYLEDLLRSDDAPASTSTALVAYALNALKADGLSMATLGGVPLARERGWDAHPVTPLERLAYRLRPVLSLLYSFDGLETFKRRFGPAHWENEFLALPAGLTAQVRVAGALTRLVLTGR
ncbi:phosphatidylglycerol lysyltransferase domain-containing protein [Deinococcus altitudinis]|uniref:phosphatidylglycerol lysyltransferase domain-containing protein n=1 Tax=Deinococcus altitudinis TaxID=468914 RepID=UPI0038929FDA